MCLLLSHWNRLGKHTQVHLLDQTNVNLSNIPYYFTTDTQQDILNLMTFFMKGFKFVSKCPETTVIFTLIIFLRNLCPYAEILSFVERAGITTPLQISNTVSRHEEKSQSKNG